jgi:hypothetical protein
VLGEVEDLPGECGAAVRIIGGEDGSVAAFELVDLASGAVCRRGSGHCRPRHVAYEEPNLFEDDACTTEVSVATSLNAPGCAPPDFIRPLDAEPEWYTAGPAYDGDLYSGLGDCQPALDQPWINSLYELGEAVSSADLVELGEVLLGDGRLQARVVTEGDTPLIPAEGEFIFYDTELSAECFLRLFDDGTYRCIASNVLSGTSWLDEWQDDGCTVPIRRCGADCDDTIIYDVDVLSDSCGTEHPATAVWRITEPATAYYRGSPESCVDNGTPSEDMWLVESVPLSDFPEIELLTAD